jgi:hypothetical protein
MFSINSRNYMFTKPENLVLMNYDVAGVASRSGREIQAVSMPYEVERNS